MSEGGCNRNRKTAWKRSIQALIKIGFAIVGFLKTKLQNVEINRIHFNTFEKVI